MDLPPSPTKQLLQEAPTDVLGRRFEALRLSLTPVCNLACVYCVEEDNPLMQGDHAQRKGESLPVQELIQLVARLHEMLQLKELRLTGGEPLLYAEMPALMQGLRQIGIPRIYMTTNAYLLARKLEGLQGLDGINVSLDALDEEIFYKVSRRKHLDRVLQGIDAALAADIPVKLNAALLKGVNDNQVLPLLDYARDRQIPIRYLELMKMGHLYGQHTDFYYPAQAILDQISSREPIEALPRTQAATARYWALPDGYRFGIIANESLPFCADCNRLRLDSQGLLYGCLSDPGGQPISTSQSPEALRETLQRALGQKQQQRFSGSQLSMKAIGG